MHEESPRGNVSRIQYFSTGDGDGIRTTVFLQGCSLRCRWCHNPETQPMEPVTLRYANGRQVLSGQSMTAQEVFRAIVKDEPFYLESGGGVTFSGGEPLLQADFCACVAEMCKQRGIHVLFDTAGCVPFAAFEKVLPFADQFYYDVKTCTKEDCERYVGPGFETILANLQKLCTLSRVRVRIPVIPGHNNTPQMLARFAELIAPLGAEGVDLLPFHRLGAGKYRAMGIPYSYADTEPLSPSDLDGFKPIFENLGIPCRVER